MIRNLIRTGCSISIEMSFTDPHAQQQADLQPNSYCTTHVQYYNNYLDSAMHPPRMPIRILGFIAFERKFSRNGLANGETGTTGTFVFSSCCWWKFERPEVTKWASPSKMAKVVNFHDWIMMWWYVVIFYKPLPWSLADLVLFLDRRLGKCTSGVRSLVNLQKMIQVLLPYRSKRAVRWQRWGPW